MRRGERPGPGNARFSDEGATTKRRRSGRPDDESQATFRKSTQGADAHPLDKREVSVRRTSPSRRSTQGADTRPSGKRDVSVRRTSPRGRSTQGADTRPSGKREVSVRRTSPRDRSAHRPRGRRACIAILCALACIACAVALIPAAVSRIQAAQPAKGASTVQPADQTAKIDQPSNSGQTSIFSQSTPNQATFFSPTPDPKHNLTPPPEETTAPTEPFTIPETLSVTLCAAGDTTLGGDVRTPGMDFFTRQLKKVDRDYSWFLREVRPVFEAADIAMVNLEGPLTTAKKERKKTYAFKAPPEYVKVLTEGGVSLVNLANNHTGDYFAAGLKDTKRTLSDAGIAYCGAGEEAILTRNGVRVGFLGFHDRETKTREVTAAIRKLRPEVDVLVVSFHWGGEYVKRPGKAQTALGRAAVDAGADLVLGTHSHIIGGVERYKGRYIVYGLGNFCFGGNSDPDDQDTFIFRQTFTLKEGMLNCGDMEVIPCAISSVSARNNFQPKPYTKKKDIDRVLKKLRDRSKGLKHAADIPDAASRQQST